MQNIRRLYLYAVSFVSLEVVLWGSIGLLRSLFAGQDIGGGNVSRLAGALALIFVGIPVFAVHWWIVQRGVQNEPEERSARIRAIFLYGVLLATLIPIVQNALTLLDHFALQILGLPTSQIMLGGRQVWSDNLIAMFANGIAAFYFYRTLGNDWRAGPQGDAFPEIRRLFRYIWLVYSVVLVSAGLQQLAYFVLSIWDVIGNNAQVMLAHGLVLLVFGAPIWIFTGRLIQRSLADPAEADSILRLVVIYLLVFISIAAALASAGYLVYEILRFGLGAMSGLADFLNQVAAPVSVLIPAGLVWAYYRRSLNAAMNSSLTEPARRGTGGLVEAGKDWQQRAGLRRLYYYMLAFLGLLAAFSGLQVLFASLLQLALAGDTLGAVTTRDQLAMAIASLVIGLPLWIVSWRPMMIEAASEGEAADFARRSLVRRTYLYLVLFAGVIGVMVSAGVLIYQIFRALLGDPAENLLLIVTQQFVILLMFIGLLVYHWFVLRGDGRLAVRSLARRYAQFPVLILAPDDVEFSNILVRTLQNQVPGLPVAVHIASQGAPDPSLAAARAIILPAELANRPSEALRLWLSGYSGERLALTLPSQGWYWIPMAHKSLETLARQTAQVVRRLAEDQEVLPPRENTSLMVLAYVFAGFFALELIWGLIALLASLIFR